MDDGLGAQRTPAPYRVLGYRRPVRKVAVAGATGRMGAEVCRAVEAAEDLELVAAVGRRGAGRPLDELVAGVGRRLVVADALGAVAAAGAEVLVDFTTPEVAATTLAWCATAGIHAVSGTTGFEGAALDRLAAVFAPEAAPNAVVAANFAISAVLLMRLAEEAAPFFDGIEVVELHHDRKRDAPSGTALETARRIVAARAAAGAGPLHPDPTEVESLPGSRGGEVPGGVRVHAVRLPGLVAHEEVLLGAPGQTLTIRQDSYDRSSFMPGVLLAVRRVPELPGLTLGLDPLLRR